MSQPVTDEQISDLARFKQVEQLGHFLAYQDLDQAQNLVPADDEDGVKRSYKIKRVKDTHSGLVCQVLYSEEADNPRVHVLFRGTHNFASVRRDLEKPSSPGRRSYMRDEEKIMATIKEIVRKKQTTSNEKVVLSIVGHSLGGGDAKNCIASVLHAIAENEPVFADLGTINLMHINSVGVGHSVEKQAKADVQKIKATNNPLKINQFAIMVGGDAVQQTGYTSILADLPHEQVNTKLLKAEVTLKQKLSASELFFILILSGPLNLIKALLGKPSTYEAHTLNVYDHATNTINQVAGKAEFRIYHNKNPKDALVIEKELHNKALKKLYKPITVAHKTVHKHITPLFKKHKPKLDPDNKHKK